MLLELKLQYAFADYPTEHDLRRYPRLHPTALNSLDRRQWRRRRHRAPRAQLDLRAHRGRWPSRPLHEPRPRRFPSLHRPTASCLPIVFLGLRPAPRVHPRQQPNRASHKFERNHQRGWRREQRARGRRDSRAARHLRWLGHDAVDVHFPVCDDRSVEQLYRDRNRHPARWARRVRFWKRDGSEGHRKRRCAWG